MHNTAHNYFKIIILISLSFTSQAYGVQWESWVSQNKSLNRTFVEADIFTVDVTNKSVSINNRYSVSCDKSYGTKYGTIAFDKKLIKLKFTCNSSHKYSKDSFVIASNEGMQYAYDFLSNNKTFTYQISSPTNTRGASKLRFQKTLKETISNPLNRKTINESTKGQWVGIKGEDNKYFLYENVKRPRDNLVNITYDAKKKTLELILKLSKVSWTDGSSRVAGALSQCDYLKFKSKTGTIYINDQAIKFPLLCGYGSTQTTISNINVVKSVGYLEIKDITVKSSAVKGIETLNKINYSFEFDDLEKSQFSKTISTKRTIAGTRDAIKAKKAKDSAIKNMKTEAAKKKVDRAL